MDLQLYRRSRLARPDDYPEIAQLWAENMKSNLQIDPQFFDPAVLDETTYINYLMQWHLPVFVLLIGDKVKGFATIGEVANGIEHCNTTPYCSIGEFVVSQHYKLSYADCMLKEIWNWAKNNGYKRVDITIHAKDKRTRTYMADNGWVKVFERYGNNLS